MERHMHHHHHHSHHNKHAKKASSKVYVETSQPETVGHSHFAAASEPSSAAQLQQQQQRLEMSTAMAESEAAAKRRAAPVQPSSTARTAALPVATTTTGTTAATTDTAAAASDRVCTLDSSAVASYATVSPSAAAVASIAAASGRPATTTTAAMLSATRLQQSPLSPHLASQVSHDISTEQLLSDQLIDGRVIDSDDNDEGGESSDDDAAVNSGHGSRNSANSSRCDTNRSHKDSAALTDSAVQCPPTTKCMYRIESHSALRSLEAKHLDTPSLSSAVGGDDTEVSSNSTATSRIGGIDGPQQQQRVAATRASVSKPHKLTPLPGAIVTTAAGALDTLSRTHESALSTDATAAAATAASLPTDSASAITDATAPASVPCTACISHRDMPPMHCAAYAGHVACLEALLLVADSSSSSHTSECAAATADSATAASNTPVAVAGSTNRHPQSNEQQQQTDAHLQRRLELDKKHRTPLFYACAANRIECVALLLVHRAHWRDLPDKQGDTPVHVCCFFGTHACLATLLDAGANPHGRNAKGFKPSHIATTKDCLALLLSFGDDLVQGDKLGRTPLFVASARDRSDCVAFLCAWNYESRSWMLEQEDARGDRPIHAAACNGSAAALQVLLTYGADPRIANAKALTPKDLAAANHHVACVELLTRAEDELARAATWFAPANAVAAGASDDSSSVYDSRVAGTDSAGRSHSDSGDGGVDGRVDRGWIECWDYDSGQPFYYHNLSGKCQWEVPRGFTPQLLQRQQQQDHQQPVDNQMHEHAQRAAASSGADDDGDRGADDASGDATNNSSNDVHGSGGVDDDGSEYVWVKKKKQTVCVVAGRATEWTAVQDPASRAIYYKNTRTGQSQWEEPDAVQQLQSAAGAHAAQEASRIWDELEQHRTALAAALAKDKHRQLAAHAQTLEHYKQHLRERRDEMHKREEQARLQQLLPRSSFVRRKKQSMMMKIAPPGRTASAVAVQADDERLEQICAKEPALDILLSTYVKLQGVRDLQVMTTERRFGNCLYHYYVALADPTAAATAATTSGLSKSQFRAFLRDAAIVPSSAGAASIAASAPLTPPLQLHVVDLIFAQAARAEAIEAMSAFPNGVAAGAGVAGTVVATPGSPHSKQLQQQPPSLSPTHASALLHHRQAAVAASPAAGDAASRLTLAGFLTAMQIVRDRVATQVESRSDDSDSVEIDDDEEWFLTTFLLPLTLKLGSKLLTQIRECKELDLQISASAVVQTFLAQQRPFVQQLHRHYSSDEPRLKMLTFRGLSCFAIDFGVLSRSALPALHQLYEAVNWISGNAHTEIISFEKFQQLLTMLACFRLTLVSGSSGADGGSAAASRCGAGDATGSIVGTASRGGSTSSIGGQAWRAVPSFSPSAPGGVSAVAPGSASTPTIDSRGRSSASSATGIDTSSESDHRVLAALREFFQQLEHSPAKHRIRTDLAASASTILASPSLHKLSRMGQSTRAVVGSSGIAGGISDYVGAAAARGTALAGSPSSTPSGAMVRTPSTPMMMFRSQH